MNKEEAKKSLTELSFSYNKGAILDTKLPQGDYISLDLALCVVDNISTLDIVRPTLPEYIVKWIAYCRSTLITVDEAIKHEKIHTSNYAYWGEDGGEITYWLNYKDNIDKFTTAWVVGCKKEEPLYTVELPDKDSSFDHTYLVRKLSDNRIIIKQFNGEVSQYLNDFTIYLTEAEIRENHEYLWGLAEPVKDIISYVGKD